MRRQIKFSIWFPIVLVVAFAAGYLFWQKTLIPGPYDLEPVNIVRHQTADNFDTSNWQTYQKEKATYGIRYQVSYPLGWTLSTDEYYFAIKDKNGSIFTIEIPPSGFGIDPAVNYEEIIVDGKQALSLKMNFKGGNIRDEILIQFKEKSLENIQIRFTTQEGKDSKVFYQILSTFKFILLPDKICIQVITSAKNPETGKVKYFSTPCDVPEGWEVIK